MSPRPWPDDPVARMEAMENALRAVLLFHGEGSWGDEARAKWASLTGDREATTRGLCDCVRAALGEGE